MYRTFIPARGLSVGWDILARLLATKWRRIDSHARHESLGRGYLLISKGLQAVWEEPALALHVPL